MVKLLMLSSRELIVVESIHEPADPHSSVRPREKRHQLCDQGAFSSVIVLSMKRGGCLIFFDVLELEDFWPVVVGSFDDVASDASAPQHRSALVFIPRHLNIAMVLTLSCFIVSSS